MRRVPVQPPSGTGSLAWSSHAGDLDELRRSAGLSYRDLARRAGCPRSTVNDALSGRRFPRLDTVLAIVRVCGGDVVCWRARWADAERARTNRAGGTADQGRPASAQLPHAASGDGDRERPWRLAVEADAELSPETGHNQDTGWSAASSPGMPRPLQLPADTGHFIGRGEELDRLLGLMLDGGPHAAAPLVAVVSGMAGIGKTALVVHAAHRMSGRFPDGVLFVDLRGFTAGAEATTPEMALETLVRGLGVPGDLIPPRLDARTALYRSTLAGRRVLVVLDNAVDEAQVRPLLPGTRGCLVLVTSRRRLAGLDEAEHLVLDSLGSADAVNLFGRVAGEHSDCTAEVAERIVDLCACLPLAIRITAARLRVSATTPLALCAELQTLRTRLAALDDGERSIVAAFTVSYQHLPSEQQRMFRLLGLAPGAHIDHHAAAALTDLDLDQARQQLNGLEAANLVDQPATGRYRLHDLLRAYATQRVLDDESEPARQAALTRLLDHYAYTASIAMDVAYPHEIDDRPRVAPVHTPTPVIDTAARAVAWLDSQHTNLVAAAAHAAGRRLGDHAWRLPAILHRHLHLRGYYADAEYLHCRALAAAGGSDDASARLTSMINLGDTYYAMARDDKAAAQYREALRIASDLGHRTGERASLMGLGRVLQAAGRYEQAEHCLQQSLAIAGELGHRNGEHTALYALGYVYRLTGRCPEAADHLQQALAIAREIGNRTGEHATLTGLGYLHLLTGQHQRAEHYLRQALRIARDLGDRLGTLRALNVLGEVHCRTGRYRPAADRLTEALTLARDIGDRSGEVNSLCNLGRLHRLSGDFTRATERLQQALQLAHTIGDRNGIFEALHGLGHTLRATGRAAEALAHHEAALNIARELNQPHDQARAHDAIAHAYHALGHPQDARDHWQQALDIHVRLGSPEASEIQDQLVESPLPDQTTNGPDKNPRSCRTGPGM